MKQHLSPQIIEKSEIIESEFVQDARGQNAAMKSETEEDKIRKKEHSAKINKAGRNVKFLFLYTQASVDVRKLCTDALDKSKLDLSSAAGGTKKEFLEWIAPTTSNASNLLREELAKIETKLLANEIIGRKKGEKLDGSFTKTAHGSMTWYYIGNGIKWLVDMKIEDSSFDLQTGAMEVYHQYVKHIQLEGK